jgi:hypothetical protein
LITTCTSSRSRIDFGWGFVVGGELFCGLIEVVIVDVGDGDDVAEMLGPVGVATALAAATDESDAGFIVCGAGSWGGGVAAGFVEEPGGYGCGGGKGGGFLDEMTAGEGGL